MRLNGLMREAGLDPDDCRLLRHQNQHALPGRSPYHLWRDDAAAFHRYQFCQSIRRRTQLAAPFWVVFVATPDRETLFVGLWRARYIGLNAEPRVWEDGIGGDAAGTVDAYDLAPDDRLADLAGRLVVDWGSGERARVQYAARLDKQVLELRRAFREPEFPGYLEFQRNLSEVARLHPGWRAALRAARALFVRRRTMECCPSRTWDHCY